MVRIRLEKFVHGGQVLGYLHDGKPIFVWGGLPGELVDIHITRKKRTYSEAVVDSVVEPSIKRIKAVEPSMYLSTSPWQILDYKEENIVKQNILSETFSHENIDISWTEFCYNNKKLGYRNKMEYNFWWDNGKLDVALHGRGSHQKIAVKDSLLADDKLNTATHRLVEFLNASTVGGRQIKSVIIRSSAKGEIGYAVYVVDPSLKNLAWDKLSCAVLKVYFSDPKSPASVGSELLVSLGNENMTDSILGREYAYSVEGFFQVNLPIYEESIKDIRGFITSKDSVVDFYGGVGSIGMSLNSSELFSVEVDEFAHRQAQLNADMSKNETVVLSTSEAATEYITSSRSVVVDPPRAGLHKYLRQALVDTRPPKIIYLSCNPVTQARDCKEIISGGYRVQFARGYNFFPRTPHIESLVVLERID